MSVQPVQGWRLCRIRGIVIAVAAVATLACWPERAAADEAILRYVSGEGQDRGDCTLPVRPCGTVQYAMSVAGKTDRIRVARGTYEIPDLDDAAYLVHGSVEVRGGFDRFDHFLTQAPAHNQTTLIGVPLEFRDRLRAQGFHVIVDRKGLDSGQRMALGAMLRSVSDVACVNNAAGAHACDKLDLLAHVALGDMAAESTDGADIWGFVDLNTAREYALIGLRNGMAVFDVTDPRAPFEVGHVSGTSSTWRDAKVLQRFDRAAGRWKSYAYVSSEVGGRLIVVDLTGLPNRIGLARERPETSIHNVHVSNVDLATGVPLDETGAPPLLYALGGSDNAGGFVAYDLSDPLNPVVVANSTGGYSHDAASFLVTDSRASTCGGQGACPVLIDFNEDTFDLWDFGTASRPRMLSSTTYPGVRYVHSGWPTEDGRHVFVHDELDERRQEVTQTTVRVFSLGRFTNPVLAGSWSGTTAAIDHNGFVRGNRYYLSNYSRGLTVLDITDPTGPTQAGYFDTYPTNDATTYSGAWGVYPFLPSGNLLVSDIAGGLYVLGDRTRASEHGKVGFTTGAFGGAEGNAVSVTVARSDGSNGAVSVDYAVVPASADASDVTASSGTLEWAADADGERTITVSLVDDGTSEPVEFVLVRLTSPKGGAVLSDTNMAAVFVGDSGTSPTVGFAESGIAVEETAGRAVATVWRMGSPVGAVSVQYAAHADTATLDGDYLAPGGSELLWADGDATPRTIVVGIVADAVDESVERFEVRLSAPAGATLATTDTLSVTVNADAPGVDLSQTDVTFVEGDEDSYTVALRTRPDGIVAMELTSNGDPDISVVPERIEFGTADWDMPRRVAIMSAPDTDYEDDSATIDHVLVGGGYDSVTAGVRVTVPDRSIPGRVGGLDIIDTVESLVVSWTELPGADGYKVQWKSAAQDYNETDRQRTVAGGSTTSHAIPNLTAGQQYTIRVTATGVSDGTPSEEHSGTPQTSTPGRVTGVDVAEAVESLSVSWTAVADADGYKVQWTSGSEAYNETDRQHIVSSGSTTLDAIPGLTAGTEYTVRVKATRQHAAQDGLPSAERRGTPQAPAAGQVTGVRLTAGVGSLAVSWTAIPNADGYKVQWKSGGQAYNATDRQRIVSGGSNTALALRGLTPGTLYQVRVIARRTNAEDGIPSAEGTGTPAAARPGRPQGLSVTPTVERLAVSWNLVTDADGYKVQWKSAGQQYNETDRQRTVSDGGTTAYSIDGLEPGSEITVRVKATRAHAADGEPSAERAATPRAERPGQVTGVSVLGAPVSLIVSWHPVDGADGYRVQWKSGAQSYSTVERHASVSGGSVSMYTIVDLTPGTRYTLRVRATNAYATEDGLSSEERDGVPAVADAEAPPRLETVVVADRKITLTYDRSLDGSARPAPSDFTVTVAGRGSVEVLGVAVDGATVTLTLRDGVAHGERATVRYAPGATPLRSEAGTAAPAIGGTVAVETIVSMAPVRVAEGEVAVFRAMLSRAVAEELAVEWAVADGTARAGVDYSSNRTGSLTIPSGKNDGAIEIATLQDSLGEEDETFSVSLSEPADFPFWALLKDAAATATVVDDDLSTGTGTGGSSTSGSTGGTSTGGTSTGGSGSGGSTGGSTGGGGGGGGGGGSRNRPPVVTEEIAAQMLDVGDSVEVDAAEHFRDPDRRRMEFAAESAHPSIATVEVEGSVVTIRGVGHGVAEVTVTATDHRRAQATQEFTVSVGHEVSFAEPVLSVAEGATAMLAVTINRLREVPTTLDYTIGVDTDVATADADDVDHDGADGTLVLGPGEREAAIEIAVHDDSDIEPPRETFVVTLARPAGQADAYGLGLATMVVTIAEGVCDRTVQVRNALRRSLPCDAVSATELTRIRALDLAQRGIAALRPRDLSGLTALRTLDMSENGLLELPPGLFEGLAELESVRLQDNPGAPFELLLQLERTDAEPSAPGPATVVARLVEGAPFPMAASVTAINGTSSADQVALSVGATESAPFVVTAAGGAVRVTSGEAPKVPTASCGDFVEYLCYQGLATAAVAPLVLFKDPPSVTAEAPRAELGTDGDAVRIDLSGLFAASDGGMLTYIALSGDPALATVTVDGTVLTVRSGADGSEGLVTITVTATDADGLSVTLDLEAQIEFMPQGLLRGWRRVLIIDELGASAPVDRD